MAREIVLDTETTGFDPDTGDRIVEIGAIELMNYLPTGRHFHVYINPERDMPADALARIEQDDLVPPSRLGVAIPAAVEQVLLKGLSLRGAERHQDMIELLGDFEAALSGRK